MELQKGWLTDVLEDSAGKVRELELWSQSCAERHRRQRVPLEGLADSDVMKERIIRFFEDEGGEYTAGGLRELLALDNNESGEFYLVLHELVENHIIGFDYTLRHAGRCYHFIGRPGWLHRVLEENEKDIQEMPDWLKMACGLD